MIRRCQVLPIDLKPQIEKQKDQAGIESGNGYFHAHGVGVDKKFMSVKGRTLFPPAIQFGGRDCVEPDEEGREF